MQIRGKGIISTSPAVTHSNVCSSPEYFLQRLGRVHNTIRRIAAKGTTCNSLCLIPVETSRLDALPFDKPGRQTRAGRQPSYQRRKARCLTGRLSIPLDGMPVGWDRGACGSFEMVSTDRGKTGPHARVLSRSGGDMHNDCLSTRYYLVPPPANICDEHFAIARHSVSVVRVSMIATDLGAYIPTS